jgi:hypothetical protein
MDEKTRLRKLFCALREQNRSLQCAAHGGVTAALFSRRAVRAAKIKLIITSRDACAAMVYKAPCEMTRIIDFTFRFPMVH